MKSFKKLPKLSPGDKVAVLSPSSGLPEIFPWVFEHGLKRLQDIFDLQPIEYPTTRQMNAPLQDRARDILSAFEDEEIKAIFTSIGGYDQIRLIRYLDSSKIAKNPKPFFGFSDNTHIHNYLWNLGIPSYYGGSVMTQFAMQLDMHDITVKSLRHALFDHGEFDMDVSETFNDIGLSWEDPGNLKKERIWEPNYGLFWDGEESASGVLWGGCVESLIVQMSSGIYLPKDDDLEDTILFIETAEDIPEPWIPQYLLYGMGERGWLNRFKGVLVGRPKAWEFNKQLNANEKEAYKEEQRKVIVDSIRAYNTSIPIVQNLDFGHTDPQIILPMGNRASIDPKGKNITLSY